MLNPSSEASKPRKAPSSKERLCRYTYHFLTLGLGALKRQNGESLVVSLSLSLSLSLSSHEKKFNAPFGIDRIDAESIQRRVSVF